MTLPTQFEERLRYEFKDIGPDSWIIDLGGFHGQWTKEMVRRYDCHADVFEPVFWRESYDALRDLPKVTLHPVGAGHKYSFSLCGVQGDRTGVYNKENMRLIPLYDFARWFKEKNRTAECLKINTEGSEYQIVEALISTGLITRVKHLQVQFHHLADWCIPMHETLRSELALTHEMEFDFPFIWTQWRLK